MFIFIDINFNKIADNDGSLQLTASDTYFGVENDDKSIQVRLRKRTGLPRTYCHALDQRTVQFGYSSRANNVGPTDEFLHVTLATNGTLRIARDIQCTLPLFYAYQQGRFILSNTRDEVISRLSKLQVHTDTLIYSLITKNHAHLNLWQEIHVLEEEQVLHVSQDGLQLVPGIGRKWASSSEVETSQPRYFIDVLDASFERLLADRLSGQSVAFEISGGLDSCTLPLYMAKKNPEVRMLGVVMAYPGDYYTSQQQKIATLQQTTGIKIVQEALHVGVNHPLSRITHPDKKWGQSVHPTFLEVYHEPTKNIAQLLEKSGIDTIVTGIGGDELFEHALSPEAQLQYGNSVREEYMTDLPPYVTDHYTSMLAQAIPDKPLSALPTLPHTLQIANIARNNTYIEHGIWPVSQFSDPALFEFCQGLPIQFRANKNILRAYHQAQQFPENIFNASVNEDFEDFFTKSFYANTYTNTLTTLLDQSITAQRGYINKTKLKELYSTSLLKRDPSWLFHLYCWMCTEIDLQSHASKAILV